ncbi:aldolase [uncultured Aeromicrobium sp.]|uniref:Cgl0159 family (beta/alpha)8-fold protein n=1 Tax=uncultured Aeromicrobium sp. TaxID=337820 RepID=UPI0025FBA9D6|nr:aldolase [uncultured Aeromicrobium sp.]
MIDIDAIVRTRVKEPELIMRLAQDRALPVGLSGNTGRLLIVAADHPARGALQAGTQVLAMADRADLLDRLVRALARPGVDGVLATADIVEDLLLLGALEHKVVIGSMNRGGLAGTVFEIDDRFTGYRPAAIAQRGFQGGKMLVRIDPQDPRTPRTLESAARMVEELSDRGLMAMVEPFISHRTPEGRLVNELTTEAAIRSATVAAGLASTSAHTWLKLPAVEDMNAVLAATTLPVMLLGGEVAANQSEQFAAWSAALTNPTVRGMAIGRSLLYPPDDEVERAVDSIVEMM